MKYCRFNNMIDCNIPVCEKCGWNPDVHRIRMAAIRKVLALDRNTQQYQNTKNGEDQDDICDFGH